MFLAGFVTAVGFGLWTGTIFQRPASAEIVISTSSMIVQISSFVGAGYVVGLFYYLAEYSKGLRELRKIVYKWAFTSEKTFAYFESKKKELKWDELSRFTLDKFATVLSPFVLFIFAGLAAVSAGLTGSNTYEAGSLGFFAFGLMFMIVSFWLLHTGTEALLTTLDVFEALKPKNAS